MTKEKISLIIILACIFCLCIGVVNSLKGFRPKKEVAVKSEQKTTGTSAPKIALITLEGIISAEKGNMWSAPYSSDRMLNLIKEAKKDNSVKGVVLRINSQGGTVGASQEIYNEIMDLRKEKPVVASLSDVAASGGYYIASAADRIVTLDGTVTGSIGVIFNTVEISSLADKLGIKANVIKSGEFKDVGSIYKPMSAGEKTLLGGIITSTYNQFVSAIEEGRIKRTDKYSAPKTELTVADLKKYADGRIFNGEQAVQYGFADSLGGLTQAHAQITEMAIQKFNMRSDAKLPLVEYNKKFNFEEVLFSGVSVLSSLIPLSFSDIVPFELKNNHRTLYIME